MGTAGLATEVVGQLTEGEAAVQDRAYPRLSERSDIILLLAPAADHKSLQARLLGQKIDGRQLHPETRSARQSTRYGPLRVPLRWIGQACRGRQPQRHDL